MAASGRVYDDAANAELAALREMETAVAAEQRVPIGPKALARAAKLATASNADLAWLAVNVLARCDDAQRARPAIQWLGTYPADRQAKLCWSLLVSGQNESIDAVLTHLDSHRELLAQLRRAPLIELAADEPAKYKSLLPLLVATCQAPDERSELFRLQAPAMNDAWAGEIERACAGGLLRDRVDRVVIEIVSAHRAPAYPLARRLLEKHRNLSLAGLPAAELEPLLPEDPDLAGELAQQWMIRGSEPQRAAALAVFCDPRCKLSAERLRLRLQADHPRDPASLLSAALARTQPQALDLAEFLLADAAALDPERIAYETASSAALARPKLRSKLLALAWHVPERGQRWALEQLLGAALVRQLQEADATRGRQLELLAPLVHTLDGKLVTLKNVGASAARDRGLQMAARELPHLPSSVDTASWAPEAESSMRLTAMRTQLEPIRESAEPIFSEALDQLDRYVSDLIALNCATLEITKTFDIVIAKQLPGGRREMQLKRLDSWDFRFPASSLETFQRECNTYRELLKSLDTTRRSLVIVNRLAEP